MTTGHEDRGSTTQNKETPLEDGKHMQLKRTSEAASDPIEVSAETDRAAVLGFSSETVSI